MSYVKALVGVLNQEKALVGAFSMILKTDGSFAALLLTAHQQQQMYRPTHSGRHAARWAIFLIDLLHKLYVCNLNI